MENYYILGIKGGLALDHSMDEKNYSGNYKKNHAKGRNKILAVIPQKSDQILLRISAIS